MLGCNCRPHVVAGLVILACLTGWTSAGKVLIVSTMLPSHMMYINAPGEALISRGHEVYTVLGTHIPEPKDLQKKGFKIIKFQAPSGAETVVSNSTFEELMSKSVFEGRNPPAHGFLQKDCEMMLEDATFMQKLRGIKFDIALVDGFFVAQCGLLIPHVLGIPYVHLSTMIDPMVTRCPVLPSFVPAANLAYSDKMTFFQRLINLASSVMMQTPFVPIPGLNDYTLVRKYSRDPTIRTWNDLASKSELFFLTRGPIMEYPLPSMPNIIYLEAMTAKPAKPLSAEFEDLVNSAEHGVIVVSFGSMFGAFPEKVLREFLDAFGRRKEQFLWRISKDKAPKSISIPANVRVSSWLPQNDLLGHPKTKLFITHCGNNGQYEAVYHGVPMIGFPLFGDQEHNAKRMTSHGFGLSANIITVKADELEEKIEQVVSNPTFKKSAQRFSAILKSKPMTAIEEAGYWIDYVMKFGGSHLRSYAMDMPAYQYLMLDIAAFVTVIFVALLALIIYAIKALCRVCFKGKVRKQKVN